MCHSVEFQLAKVQSSPRKQHGLGLPLVIFIIVVLGMLTIAIMELSHSAAEAVGDNVQSTRAFYAAESGIQSALARQFPVNIATPATPAKPSACIADFSLAFTAAPGLISCSVEVSCNMELVNAGTLAQTRVFSFTSTGDCPPAKRRIRVRARGDLL